MRLAVVLSVIGLFASTCPASATDHLGRSSVPVPQPTISAERRMQRRAIRLN